MYKLSEDYSNKWGIFIILLIFFMGIITILISSNNFVKYMYLKYLGENGNANITTTYLKNLAEGQGKKNIHYYAEYNFKSEGKIYSGKNEIDENIFNSLSNGNRVNIFYDKNSKDSVMESYSWGNDIFIIIGWIFILFVVYLHTKDNSLTEEQKLIIKKYNILQNK